MQLFSNIKYGNNLRLTPEMSCVYALAVTLTERVRECVSDGIERELKKDGETITKIAERAGVNRNYPKQAANGKFGNINKLERLLAVLGYSVQVEEKTVQNQPKVLDELVTSALTSGPSGFPLTGGPMDRDQAVICVTAGLRYIGAEDLKECQHQLNLAKARLRARGRLHSPKARKRSG